MFDLISPDSLKKYPQYADLRDFIEFSIAPWAWEEDAITNMAMKPSDFKKLQTEFSSALNEISRLREALDIVNRTILNGVPILEGSAYHKFIQQALSANQEEK